MTIEEKALMGFKRAVVPLDGSPVAEAILPFVSRIARPLDLELTLLRVVPAIAPQVIGGTRNMVIDNTERLRQEAEVYVKLMANRLCEDGLRAQTAVRVGDAATEILEGARECQAELIAMTTHGRSALGRLLFGSVAEAVLHRAHVPVFLFRTTEKELGSQAA